MSRSKCYVNVIKIVTSLEDSGLVIKGVNKKIKNETKEQKCGFFGMLLGTLGTSFLGHVLAGKSVLRAGRESKKSWSGFLMRSHSLTNFDILQYYGNKPKFRVLFSRNNLPKIKKG